MARKKSDWKTGYYSALRELKDVFYENHKDSLISRLSPLYEPRQHLGSYDIEASLAWPKRADIGHARTIPLEVHVESASGYSQREYKIMIKMTQAASGRLIAASHDHVCDSTRYPMLRKQNIACRHIYRALLEADRICEERGLDFIPSMFTPSDEILDDFRAYEKKTTVKTEEGRKRITAKEKLGHAFGLIERIAEDSNGLYDLDRLNRRLDTIKHP